MLLLKRLVTFWILFVGLFVILFIGTLAIGGAVAGSHVARDNPDVRDYQSGFQAGQRAGEEFGRAYRGIIFFAALGVAGVASLTFTLSGLLPWCRKAAIPPELL